MAAALVAAAFLVGIPGAARAQGTSAAGSTPGSKPASTGSATTTTSDASDHRLSQARAIVIARTDPQVAAEQERWGHLDATPTPKPGTWQVDFYAGGTERVQVIVDDATGNITETWTGYQIAWQMARGYPDQFGHKLNAPYVWIPLAAIFFFALLDFRRKWRIVHLDLLVLLSFGISEIYFNQGNIGVSVPLTYPPLLYLLGRMIWVGFRGAGEGLRPSTPTAWLAIGGAFLLVFRIALNIADSGVIDVGYAGVIGANHLLHGQAIWNNFPSDNVFGDTYAPFNYYAYVPFDLVFPWSGHWDNLPAAHAAAIAFDLATVGGLFAAGDRGLLTRGDGSKSLLRRWRPVGIFCLSLAVVIGAMLALPAIDPGLGTFYDRTVKSQLDRTSPFSVWGQDHSLEWLQTAFKVFAVALAIGVAFLPRRRSLPQVAALAAAVMIAVEITAEHWFYLYIPWFFGLLLVGLTAATRASSSPTVTASSVASAPGVSREKVAASAR